MIKAKTSKKLFAILSAVISAVFAIIIGATYCATALNLFFKSNPNTTAVYATNNQYHVNNDTLINPVLFGSGSHNFEVSFEYDVPYNFDLRLKYSLEWTNSKPTDNAILNFANRDNIIVDQQYIFLANSVADKQGKINLIAGVSFVNPEDESYHGERLTIKITDVKVVETGLTYNAEHPLLKDGNGNALTGEASKMWLTVKQQGTANSAMVYNYRYDYNHGVAFPGDDTAYSKVLEEKTVPDTTTKYNVVQSTTWAGGNRAYAGVGMYVYAGAELKIDVEVKGIWRLNATNTVDSAISETGIKFNYTSNFEHEALDSNKLWETVKFSYVIPAKTSCYIDILESIEITSTALKSSRIKKDAYRAIVQCITINETPIEYSEDKKDNSIITKAISSSKVADTTDNYTKENIKVVNSSKYVGGLYQTQTGTAIPQNFSTDISVINNTEDTRSVTASLSLRYRISNGKKSLTQEVTEDGNKVIQRVEDLYPISQNADAQTIAAAHLNRFEHGNLFYTFSPSETVPIPTGQATSVEVTLAPYSSANILNYFTALASLQSAVVAKYGNYDVWLYYDVSVASSVVANTTSLQIETRENATTGKVDIYAKNNTQQVATITANSLTIKELQVYYSATAETNEPNDWVANFWQYYSKGDDGSYKQVEYSSSTFKANEFYKRQIILGNNLEIEYEVETGAKLNPGESILIGTVTTANSKDLILTGGVTASLSTHTTISVSNAGTSEAVLINGTNNAEIEQSVYVRVAGTFADSENNDRLVYSNGYIYYIGILRPGQKLTINMASGSGEVTTIAAGDVYAETTLSSWNDSTITAKFNALFNVDKV